MPKTYLRASAASGSDKRKVEKLLRHGWQPGVAIGRVLANNQKRHLRAIERGGQHAN